MNYRVPRNDESNRSVEREEPVWKPSELSRKIAVLFGNNKYTGKKKLTALSCCEHDAMDMRSSLIKLGFDAHAYIDKNGSTMQRIVNKFISKIKAKDLVVFYYSGHGSQSHGQNILYGVDGEIINVTQTVSAIGEKKPYAIVLLLDCCRSPGRDGLAMMSDFASIENIVVGFACSEGQAALLDKKKRNSYYTDHILHYIERGGSATEMLQLVGQKLKQGLKDSKEKQTSWYHSNFASNHVFTLKHDVVEKSTITTKLANMKLSQSKKSNRKELTTVKETLEYDTKGAGVHVDDYDESDSFSSSEYSETDSDD
jgi:hypothetical protein